MNLVYGLTLHEFSIAQVDRAPTQCLRGHRFKSCHGLRFFFWSHAHDIVVVSFSQVVFILVKS